MLKTIDILLLILTFGVLFWGIRRRMKRWSIGTADERSDQMGARIKSLLIEGIAHTRILQDRYPGLLHLFLFLGFVFPFFVILFTQVRYSLPLFLARSISLLLDVVAIAALVSIVLLFIRRTIKRPPRLDNTPQDLVVLLLILAILLTGLLLESLRLSISGSDITAWAPVGRTLAGLIRLTGMSLKTQGLLALIVFRIHFFLVLGTIASIPFTKLFHVVSSPMNMLLRSHKSNGALSHIDLEDEEAESFGVSGLEEFTWKQLLDLDACTRCGRCQDHCPAHLTEKPLSPKSLILDMKALLHGKKSEDPPSLLKDVVKEDVLWACTTCRSCMEHCPVYVEHVDKIVDMRRYQVLMESQFPEELMTAFRGLEKNSNPWGMGYDSRADWVEELHVPLMSDCQGEDLDFLFYVGCIRSYDDRNKKVALAIARILDFLGAKYAILGMEEGCCGDPARRVGNEYLYQTLAQTNIETFNRYKIKKILTTCPHCFNTLGNEYPQLGFEAEVVHHSTFLAELIQEGQLKLEHPLAQKITYHDPCYLGRYNGVYDPPRDVIRSIPSAELCEMDRSGRDALCCGAGGGWMWMDEQTGKRINIQRLEDSLALNPDSIATACPFCVTMFNDAIKDVEREDSLKIYDIAELVALSLFGT